MMREQALIIELILSGGQTGADRGGSGGWLLHGHVHTRWKINRKQINVGVDQWDLVPVNIEQIYELMHQYPDGGPAPPATGDISE